MIQGFFLGLASGVTCLAYCAPVLIPLLLGKGKSPRQNGSLMLQFLGGRLVGYLLFGLLAWVTSQMILQNSSYQALVYGVTYSGLAVLMLLEGILKPRTVCASSVGGVRAWLERWPVLLPAGMGLLTGLNICPPFLLAFANASYLSTPLESLGFFFTFFMGTLVYFIPLPFLGFFNRHLSLQTIGKMAAVVVALYYLYAGIISFIGGITKL